ncbi:unnamed protein product [Cochlearia groenlandica]
MEKSQSSSDAKGKGLFVAAVNTGDRITKLSDDILLRIISNLSTKEVVCTSALSKRWENVWKEIKHLVVDIQHIAKPVTFMGDDATSYAARSMNKVLNDHRGHLDRCTIYHNSNQLPEGMVEAWIRSLVHVKQTKHLKLVNSISHPVQATLRQLDLPLESFSHEKLETLYLGWYSLKATHGFNNIKNLKNVKLNCVFAEIRVFNAFLMSCPSLQVLVLDISCHKKSGPLKIENQNLKFLSISCSKINGVEVASPNLEILTVGSISCKNENFFIANPRLKFQRINWDLAKLFRHISYNISCPHQSVGHKFLMSESGNYMKRHGSMSVNVDLKNIKEVYMLAEVVAAWPARMTELEIVFKNSNDTWEEVESSVGKTEKKPWEKTKPFPKVTVRANNVWLFNFSGSEEEFALASHLITQGIVATNMVIIKPSSVSLNDKLEIEKTVANVRK